MRGLVGNHVLVLVDGIRLNNATFRYGPNQYLATIDPFSVDRLEVVRGSGSVLYGSDALGGVVSVLTPRPQFSDRLEASGRVTGKVVSSGMEKSGRAAGSLRAPRAGLTGGLTWRDFGDLEAGGDLGTESPSAYTEWAGDAHGALRVSSASVLHVAYQHLHQDDVPRFDQVRQRGFSRWAFDPQVRQLGYTRFEAFPGSPWFQSATATASWHRSFERRVRQTVGSAVETEEEDVVDTYGFSLEARTRPGSRWAIVWGLEHFRDQVGSGRNDFNGATGTVTPRRGLYPDGASARSTAGFVSGSVDLRTVSIHAGARLNHNRVNAPDSRFDVELAKTALVGNAAVMWRLGDSHRLFGSVTQGFRSPNIDDVSTLGPFDFGVEVPSPDLDPERTLGLELGYKLRTRRLAGPISLYRTGLDDLIERMPATFDGSEFYEGQRVYRRTNIGSAFVRGAEGEFEWQAYRGLAVFGALAYTYGHQTSTDQPMRRIPPLYGQAGLTWAMARGPSLRGAVFFAGRQDRLNPGDKSDHRINPAGTPGFAVVNLQASWPITRAFDVALGVENVFDEAYRIHGSGIDGPGRNLWLGMRLGR